MEITSSGYWEMTVLSGGTFTPATDWSAQFSSGGTFMGGFATIGGELNYTPGPTTLGIRARIGIQSDSSCDIAVYVSNPKPASPSIQVQLNGAIIGEYSSFTLVTLPLINGPNVLELIAADEGLVLLGRVFATEADALSLYPDGADPFAFRTSRPGSGSSSGPGPGDASPRPPS